MTQGHLSSQLLVRVIDGETTSAEAVKVQIFFISFIHFRVYQQDMLTNSCIISRY